MNNQQQTNAEIRVREKAERLSAARKKVLGGEVTALSIDTCIFDERGNRLNDGVFKHLEQFKGNTFRLVFSEVTIKEVLSHISRDAEEAKLKMVSALRRVGFFWPLETDHKALAEKMLKGKLPKTVALEQVKDFVTRCGTEIIEAKEFVDLAAVLSRYFNVQAPFETAGEKKSEFPDAVALLSLEAWAKKQATTVLFVTKDKGCKRFCDESARLVAIDDLTDALKLVQERDQHCISLCQALETAIAAGQYPNLISEIEDAIAYDIDIDWNPEASAAFNYNAEMQHVELLSARFSGPAGQPEFRAVDYRGDMLVVQVDMDITVEATCNFSFSIRDGIDRDMVFIGGNEVTTEVETVIDVLITFSQLADHNPQVDEIELVSAHRTIDFGAVWPDYGDEDPNSEYY
ncbi:PIN domain-containing protein [Candidatus Accumulibacter vicinus]|uniref:DUF4935 domain-containing protein n=1 Tax=Candidatus Accumulibacter vicinus TaxID=2954382 RepID=A0A084Y0D0_9PROT|nr:PIN domain-containing protein [Candidatus Accumulibacter vicinus]KFB68174.1 MAG: hypothetical protein CAPSK01_002026 [Candidatus Accumulibacter vicinus]